MIDDETPEAEIETDTGQTEEEANRQTREHGYHEVYKVTVLVGGALESEEEIYGHDEAYNEADSRATDLADTATESWAVYVLAGNIQFAQDHQPYKSGDAAEGGTAHEQ